MADVAASALVLPLGASDSEAAAGTGAARRHARTWKKNEWLVYAANFLHMTMYTMCLGSVFDIFLYTLSQEQQVLSTDPVLIGGTAAPLAPMRVDTHSAFELTFEIRPMPEAAGYSANSSCREFYTCGTSVLHVTDGSGNGDCCRIGNRMPFVFLDNSSTRLELAMDAVGQNESMDTWDYDRLQRCRMSGVLPADTWSHIKLKVSGWKQSKGTIPRSEDADGGGLMLIVNGRTECEVLGTRYHVLPERKQAYVFLGALHDPLDEDRHIPANAYVRNLKYSKPASNLFVGSMNSVQGIVAVLLMYPIGWAGDRMNRYTLTQANMVLGLAAAGLLIFAMLSRGVIAIYAGVVLFTFYQQCISALIYAILADNVVRARRTRAGVNYKTFSTLAQALGVLVQLIVVLLDPSEDDWTWRTFNLMLLPGWALLPFIAVAVAFLTPVGSKICQLPNVDELQSSEQTPHSIRRNQGEAWLDEPVCCGQRRRFVVATSVNAFFIITLLANGMTSRYFTLYFTQVKKMSPAGICLLNGVCRLWIAIFAQAGKPLARILGRTNLVVILHTGSALFTLGIYGGGLYEPSLWAAYVSYLMRFALLQTRDPLLYSITMDVVPQSQRSRWAALNSLRTLSFAASAVVGGYLADLYGYQFSFNVTVLLLLTGLVVFVPAWLWFPRSEAVHIRWDDSPVAPMVSAPSRLLQRFRSFRLVRQPGTAASP